MLSLRAPPPSERLDTVARRPPIAAPTRARAGGLYFSSVSSARLGRSFAAAAASATDVAPREGEWELGGAGRSPEDPGGLPAGLRRNAMPRHVAVIMDGNARWARRRGLPTLAGHEAGVRSLKGLIELCCQWGIGVLTIFAFSSDNWVRPKAEVELLMGLFERVIKIELENFMREGVQICMIGDSLKLPKSLQKVFADAEEMTKNNSRLQLIVAVSYSGKHDIVQACKTIARKVKDGHLELEEISERLIERELETSCSEFSCPDLLIRTSGELRLSNFMLWQLAYAELFFVQALWPDFGKAEFIEALLSYQQRQRRYGARIS
ncbi:cis-prenyltransferase 4, chloroplastic [Syzygium oleosum]|uniref:cis-prenyltransferase 4, chloroplastic n=1 Tax=Syzygium oleosum TaxID=219896 RepID=UPI0011D28BD2|nr:cis-prenyltransferase 4, chloroplastic [Syzygium oleosum]